MQVDWDVPIEMDDGIVLRADVFRPDDGPAPVILSYGPYAKGLAFQEGYPDQWRRMVQAHPDVAAGSSNIYQSWEVVDPEKWVPAGYVCLRVDSRGAGRSPGYLDPFSPRETADLLACIQWAAGQPWSTGKVGLNGISYYAINQWLAASPAPPNLAAICVWEGAADWYRDMTHHGGILSTFWANWYDMQVKTVQYGLGSRGAKSPVTGVNACGDEDLSDAELAANRTDLGRAIITHPFDDDYHRNRSANFEAIGVPLLSAANWGGLGLHSRGNFEGFFRSASAQKWLEVHGIEHWTHFYTDYGRQLQLGFFDHFLKGEDNGWDRRPPVFLQVRHVDHFEERGEEAWPVPRTEFTPWYFHPDLTLAGKPHTDTHQLAFHALGDGLIFTTEPFGAVTEITGPGAVKLWISSSTIDADLFLVLHLFDPDGNEVTFQGALDPHTPLSQGWLRASHRELDPELSQPWRPYHVHRGQQTLEPGEVYELEIEMWPTSITVPAGYRLGISVRGKDYEYSGPETDEVNLSSFKNKFTGCGPFLHDDPRDRPPEIFGGTTTVHLGPETPAFWLAPVISPR
ncbi:MAG: CocE/NonD family hydrolase [Acidimicrobiia bacterium]|nr:CocE/NonD family hydrolase [Acidimicrobiia bacterium]